MTESILPAVSEHGSSPPAAPALPPATPDGRHVHPDGHESVFLRVRDGLRLHVRVYGERHEGALPVICLPGLARTSRDFHSLATALSGERERPRRVLSLDYRGRGLSDYDTDWRRYDVRVELDDVQQVMAALGFEHGIFVGTSRGGLITMAMGAARPGAIKGVVLNDIGPVIEAKGLIRIRGYVGKLPLPRDFEEAGAVLKRIFGAQFPDFGPAEWQGYARLTWKETPEGLRPDYDPALLKGLEALDLEAPLPNLWPFFEGLRNVPVLAIRGALSDLFSSQTLAEMTQRHPRCEALEVPAQGHAPILGMPEVLRPILDFIERVDDGGGRPVPAVAAENS
jgi:pimeloyl-ACP methyl ester carboxylesterase